MRRLSPSAFGGLVVIVVMLALCVGTLPYTLGSVKGESGVRRYEHSRLEHILLPPTWAAHRSDEAERQKDPGSGGVSIYLFGTDRLGRDLLVRMLAGGGVSLGIGLAAAAIAVGIGTFYGAIAAQCGGRIDAIMMRTVDVLYGLPYILLVVLLAVAVDGLTQRASMPSWLKWLQAHEYQPLINVVTLLIAIGGVSWLTMARVIRGQVLALKEQPFMEATRAIGVPVRKQFSRHLLPNLIGPIVVYATLTVPQAILQESFLSFLGIGVKPPVPSWGNLAAEGLPELNPVRVRWWLLLWPCLFLALTLLSLNFLGEGLRDVFDPRSRRRVA